jgi:hypothetical protein
MASVVPEVELIESRTIGSIQDFRRVMKSIHKITTKRGRKVRVGDKSHSIHTCSSNSTAHGLQLVQSLAYRVA